MMYYFLPKQSGQPIWSYRLSVVSFWAFTYSYIWAGPHHLHYNSIPEWVQSLAMVMSLVLLAPSWASMINGIMTVSKAWEKLRTDPALKFIVMSLAFYGLATFEGPMMAIRSVNVVSHFTDWTIGHVHSGALGWNAMITYGTFYYLVPKLVGAELYSKKMANLHYPRSVVPESIMPAYPWLFERNASQAGNIEKKMKALKTLGHPYTDDEIANASSALEGLREIDALVRYLQMLGSSYDESMADMQMEGM